MSRMQLKTVRWKEGVQTCSTYIYLELPEKLTHWQDVIGVAGLVVKLTHRINQITCPVPNTFLTNYIFSVAVKITLYSWLQSRGKIHHFFPPASSLY